MQESPIFTKKKVEFTPPSMKDSGVVFTIRVPTQRDRSEIRIDLQDMGLIHPSDSQQQAITRECIHEVYPADQAKDVEAQYDQMLGYATEGLEMTPEMQAANRALDGILAQHSPTYQALNKQIQRFKEYHPLVLVRRQVEGWTGLEQEPVFGLDKAITDDCAEWLWNNLSEEAWADLYVEIARMLQPDPMTEKKSEPSRGSKAAGQRGKPSRRKKPAPAPSSSTAETTTNSQSA